MKYLSLFSSDEKNERIFDRIRFLIMLKAIFQMFIFKKYMKIKINSDNDIPSKEILNMHNA